MKITEFLVVIVAALLFLIPTMKKEDGPFEKQMEEAPIEEVLAESNTLRVTFRSKNQTEEPIADILWMKKAAAMAKDEGVPYFNVLEQNISHQYDRKSRQNLSVIDGVIELDPDPMRAEFDAQEIESLVLTESP